MDNILKNLKVPTYDIMAGDYVIKEIPIYAIPLNKKGLCKNMVEVIHDGEPKLVEICENSKNVNKCSKCINLGRKIAKMNGVI